MSSDSTELYYAHMEADRNEAVDAYFKARPGFGEIEKSIFRAGFERAYAKLWPLAIIQVDERQRAEKETPAVPQDVAKAVYNECDCDSQIQRHCKFTAASTAPCLCLCHALNRRGSL